MPEKKKRKVGAFAKQMGIELRKLGLKGKTKDQRIALFKKAAAAAKRKVGGGKTSTAKRRPAKKKAVSRKRKRVTRPTGSGRAKKGRLARVTVKKRGSQALPVPGFTPVPTRRNLPRVAFGTAGARPPSNNGDTYNGQPILPRVVDGKTVDIRRFTMPRLRTKDPITRGA